MYSGSIPPDFGLNVQGGSNIAASARTSTNQWTQFATRFAADIWDQYLDNRMLTTMMESDDMSNGYRAQRILATSGTVDYDQVVGKYFKSNESMKRQEDFIVPDRPILYKEGEDLFDGILANYDILRPHTIAMGKEFVRADEEKCIKALTKAALSDVPTGITYTGADSGSTDYGLAANRTVNLTTIASSAQFRADTSGVELLKALDDIWEKIIDKGDDPSEYTLTFAPGDYKHWVRTEQGIILSDKDVNPGVGNYAGGIATWDVNGIKVAWNRYAGRAYGVNVTYGFKTGGNTGNMELDFANKYSSDNTGVLAVVHKRGAVTGLTVGGGLRARFKEDEMAGEFGVLQIKGAGSFAWKPARRECAYAIKYAGA